MDNEEGAAKKDEKVSYFNDDGTATVPLKYPVRNGKDEITAIDLARPTVTDLEAGDNFKGEAAKVRAMIASVSSLPGAVIKRVDLFDLNKISEVLEEMTTGKPPATGEES